MEVYFSMAKYSFELKLQIVKAYLEGKGEYNGIAYFYSYKGILKIDISLMSFMIFFIKS
ncbi:transposase [Clostridium sporogenes]|nr:transposase [Clostridium sporogenes]